MKEKHIVVYDKVVSNIRIEYFKFKNSTLSILYKIPKLKVMHLSYAIIKSQMQRDETNLYQSNLYVDNMQFFYACVIFTFFIICKT